jgi:hypothetical protein
MAIILRIGIDILKRVRERTGAPHPTGQGSPVAWEEVDWYRKNAVSGMQEKMDQKLKCRVTIFRAQ